MRGIERGRVENELRGVRQAMTEGALIVKEMWLRKTRLLLGLGAIAAGVSIIVSVQVMTDSFRAAALREMDRLGPSVFLLPDGLATEDYLLMNYGDRMLPEGYAMRLEEAGLPGVERVEPRLLYDWVMNDRRVVLAGVTPGHLSWPGGVDAVVAGNEAAEVTGTTEGGLVSLLAGTFVVSQVLPVRGDASDLTFFFDLEGLQRLMGRMNLINEIGVTYTSAVSARQIEELARDDLPGTKILTKNRLVDARVGLAFRLRRLALAIAAVILLLGGITIANYMMSNIRERKKEIGILMAVGALPSTIQSLFFKKALIMGLVGGAAGFCLGALVALLAAPSVVQAQASIALGLLPLSLVLACACALAASVMPVRRAARTDPAQLICEGER
jgi:putative ABC transport system permease protein